MYNAINNNDTAMSAIKELDKNSFLYQNCYGRRDDLNAAAIIPRFLAVTASMQMFPSPCGILQTPRYLRPYYAITS